MPLVAAYIVPHPPFAVPEVGHGEERAIQATLDGYKEVAARIAAHAPDTIVIISPHTAYFADYIQIAGGAGASGDLAQFRAPDVRIHLTYDDAFRAALEEAAAVHDIPAGDAYGANRPLDHGMMVPLYYLDQVYPSDSYETVSIGGSALPRPQLLEFGRCIAAVAEALDRKCVLLVSGDLSHKLKADGPYGLDPAGPVFDEEFVRIVGEGAPTEFAAIDEQLCEDAAECGLSGFIMMAGALSEVHDETGDDFTSELLSYEGPFGVGYGVAAFECIDDALTAKGEAPETTATMAVTETVATVEPAHRYSADPLVNLAYETVNDYVRAGRTPDPVDLGAGVPAAAGCFVSIHTRDTDELRGCIGTIQPTCDSLAEEIIQNAISASTRDPRFPAITPAELDNLNINVDVLFPPEAARVEDLDVKRYGVIVTQGFRRGLLLPDLDGVDTVDQQLAIACAKAGIPGFGSDVELERFEVVRHT